MRLEFRSEVERDEFLILNDLWVRDGVILDDHRVQVGRVEKSNSIELTREIRDPDRNTSRPAAPALESAESDVGAQDRLRALARHHRAA
jgi:hypothetical protein